MPRAREGALLIVTCLVLLGKVRGQGPWFNADRETTYTLFKNSWPVVELYGANYSSTVFGADKIWAVNYYASWCGHCQRFAPIWKRFSHNIKLWSCVARLGALACSHPGCADICRDREIVKYPTIILYPPGVASDGHHQVMAGYSEPSLLMGLVDFLSGISPRPPSFPNLDPVRTPQEALEGRGDAEHILLICENITASHFTRNYLARLVIMDVSCHQRRVVVRRVVGVDAINLGVHVMPSLYVVHEDSSLRELARLETRQGFVNVIKREVLGMGIEGTTTVGPTLPATTVIVSVPDGVHSQDLESGVYYSLWWEVAAHKQLQSRQLAALRVHVHHLAELLPVQDSIRRWLTRLDKWLESQQGPITSDTWRTALSQLQDESGYIPKRIIWTGCRGSVPGKRGYPCSLWSIFHTLTVAAFTKPQLGITGKETLDGMRSYMHEFFSCSHCSEHFAKMAKSLQRMTPGDGSAAVTWLWRAHNKANRRLHSDPTEDMRHPKVQFPTFEACPNCHVTQPHNNYRRSNWDEEAILKYLIGFYGEDHVIYDSGPYQYIATTDTAVTPGIVRGDTSQKSGTPHTVYPSRPTIVYIFILTMICSIVTTSN